MTIPDWINSLKPTSLLSSKEVAGLLGITVTALHSRLAKNSFPKADQSIRNFLSETKLKPRSYWYVKTVIHHMKALE
jgi:hypothetical protein